MVPGYFENHITQKRLSHACDVTNAFMAPWSLDCRSIYLVNQSYMVLFKKKHGAQEVKDFCPISLIHSFCKLAIKALAQWLAPAWTSLFNLTSARSSGVGPCTTTSELSRQWPRSCTCANA
jgi:hypothetical protein